MRIYRPIGIPKTKFQCTVYAQGQKYTTKMFLFNVFIIFFQSLFNLLSYISSRNQMLDQQLSTEQPVDFLIIKTKYYFCLFRNQKTQ
jgi:hypothetical protein